MVVRLGKYTKGANVAYKEQAITWLSNVDNYDQNVTPYGEFDPMKAQFTFDRLWDVNYCKFTYDSHTYYGWVDVSTHTDGFYVYTVTIDGLTTAAYNGCFNSNVFVDYADVSDNDGALPNQLDQRLPVDGLKKKVSGVIKNINNDSYIVLVTSAGVAANENATGINPATIAYVMTPQAFNSFWTHVTNLSQGEEHEIPTDPTIAQLLQWAIKSVLRMGYNMTPFIESITNMYVIKSDQFNTAWGQQTGRIGLFGVSSNLLSDFKLSTMDVPQSSSLTGTVYKLIGNESFYKDFNVDANSVLQNMNPIRQRGTIRINVEGCGSLSFSPADYGITSISRIGYREYYDYSGGTHAFTPLVNGSVIDPTLLVKSFFPEKIPTPSSLSAEIAGNFAANASSILTNSAGPISSGEFTLTQAGQAGVGLITNYMQALQSKSTTEGAFGGSIDRAGKRASSYTFVYNDPVVITNIGDFVAMFGRPFHKMANLSWARWNNQDRHGYVKTRNCSLHSNGLDKAIIDEANSVLDSGAYIGTTNAP